MTALPNAVHFYASHQASGSGDEYSSSEDDEGGTSTPHFETLDFETIEVIQHRCHSSVSLPEENERAQHPLTHSE